MKAANATTSSAGCSAANTLYPPGGAGKAPAPGGGKGGDPASLEARVAAFKADPALMEVATRFVAEVLERAKEEASKRLREKDGAATQLSSAEGAAEAGDGAGAREREKHRLKDRADSLRAVGRSLAEAIRQQSVDGMRRLRRVWTRVQHAAE